MTMIGTTNASTTTMTSCLGVLIGDSCEWFSFALIPAPWAGVESAHYSPKREAREAACRGILEDRCPRRARARSALRRRWDRSWNGAVHGRKAPQRFYPGCARLSVF